MRPPPLHGPIGTLTVSESFTLSASRPLALSVSLVQLNSSP